MVKQEFGLCGFVIKILYRNHIQVIIEIHMILVLQIAQWGHFTIPENVFPSALGCIALQKTISIYGWDEKIRSNNPAGIFKDRYQGVFNRFRQCSRVIQGIIDRKSVGKGKSVSVSIDLGGRGTIQK